MSDHKTMMPKGESSPKETVKLIAILVGILIISLVLMKLFGPVSLTGGLRWFMGVFFIVFASFKFVGYEMFTMMFASYDVIAKHFKPYSNVYPFIELGLGLLYIFDLVPMARDVATIIVMGVGTIGVAQEIKKRSGIHCACLGNIIKLPLSTVSLIEDAGMGLMAVVMLTLR